MCNRLFTLMVGLMTVYGANVALAQSDVTLKVANYGGAFTESQKKYVADLFTARTGIKVIYIDGAGPDHVAKLIASKGREPAYDVTYLDDANQEEAIRAGVLEKLTESDVPQIRNVYESFKSKEGYGPGFVVFSVGLAYNVEKFKQAGIPEPTSWADLWDPRLAGRVAVPDISIAQGRDFLVAAARLNGGDESSLDKGIAKIASLKAHSYPKSSATIEALIKAGDVWAVPWTNGRAWGMIDKGAPLRFIMPKEGGFGHVASVDLVKGTKHRKEALAYINLVLDPLPQLGLAYDLPYGPANKLLATVIAANPEMAKKIPATPDDIAKLYQVDWVKFNANYAKAVDLWNRQVITK